MIHLSSLKSRSVSYSPFNRKSTSAHSLTHIDIQNPLNSFPISYLGNTWNLDDTWLLFAFVGKKHKKKTNQTKQKTLNVFTMSAYKTSFYSLFRTLLLSNMKYISTKNNFEMVERLNIFLLHHSKYHNMLR